MPTLPTRARVSTSTEVLMRIVSNEGLVLLQYESVGLWSSTHLK